MGIEYPLALCKEFWTCWVMMIMIMVIVRVTKEIRSMNLMERCKNMDRGEEAQIDIIM